MSNSTLPDGWQLVKFGDVVREVRDTEHEPLENGLERYIGLEHLDPKILHISRWGIIAEDDPTFTRVFRKGQLLFGRRRAYQRKAALADFDGICSGDIIVMEAKSKYLLADLLPFIVQSDNFFEYAVHTSAGSLSPRTKWSHLSVYEFPVPSMDEQRRIADILWSLEKTIEKYRSAVINIVKTQATIFTSWFSSNKENDNWPRVNLGTVCDIQSGQVDPTEHPYQDMIHIAPDDIESRTGRILEMNTAGEDGIISGKYYFPPNTILYSKIRPNLRKVALVDFEGVCSADVYPIFPKENMLKEFLFYLLLSREFTRYATICSVRSAIPKINRTDLMAYQFKLPPLEEQSYVAKRIEELFHSRQNLEQHIRNLVTLKSRLLSHLLSVKAETHV